MPVILVSKSLSMNPKTFHKYYEFDMKSMTMILYV